MSALPQTITDVVPPKSCQVFTFVVGPDRFINAGIRRARAQLLKRDISQVEHVLEILTLFGTQLIQEHGALELTAIEGTVNITYTNK